MNKWIGVFFLGWIGFFQVATANPPGESVITGNFRCKGEDFLNNKKFDEPTVVTKNKETYHFIWKNGSITFHGTGILHQQQLAIAYWNPANLADMGVVTYLVLANGDLSGRWTTKKRQITGKEYCEKIN
jgi:hypothetical protein